MENDEEKLSRVPAHLRPYLFQKGNRASAGVREGKGPQLMRTLRRIMRETEPADIHGRKRIEMAALALYQQALQGNGVAIRELWNRLCGPVPTRLEGGDPEHPVLVANARDLLISRLYPSGLPEKPEGDIAGD